MLDEKFKTIVSKIKNNEIEILTLCDESLTFAQLQEIIKALTANTSVIAIDLSHNNIGNHEIGSDYDNERLPVSENVVRLAKLLETQARFLAINLRYTNLYPKDCALLFTAIKNNNALLTVDFSYNIITAAAAESLSLLLSTNRSLLFMNLRQVQFTVSAGSLLIKGLKNNTQLASLDVEDNDIPSYQLQTIQDILKINYKNFLANLSSFPTISVQLALDLFRQSQAEPKTKQNHPLFLIYKKQLEKEKKLLEPDKSRDPSVENKTSKDKSNQFDSVLQFSQSSDKPKPLTAEGSFSASVSASERNKTTIKNSDFYPGISTSG